MTNLRTQLYKDGDHMGIVTLTENWHSFLEDIAYAWDILIQAGWYFFTPNGECTSDWQFQFSYWLPQIVAICVDKQKEPQGIALKGDINPKNLIIAVDSSIFKYEISNTRNIKRFVNLKESYNAALGEIERLNISYEKANDDFLDVVHTANNIIAELKTVKAEKEKLNKDLIKSATEKAQILQSGFARK